jgi:anaerobic magnesium-protoporphyrin IX monomethyl ester cyclase
MGIMAGEAPMILMSHSNYMVYDNKQQKNMKPYSPISTLIAASLLRKENHDVLFFDATFASGTNDFKIVLNDVRPDIAVIMEDNFNFLTKMCTEVRRQSALTMIRAARARGCRIAVNGPDASDHPELYLEAGADAIVLGEGESALRDLVNHWTCGQEEITAIPGLILPGLAPGDRPRNTRPRAALTDLDSLPHPAWDLIDTDAYQQAWRGAHGHASWNIATSRGCPYACNWCAKPTFGRRYTVRSPGDVIAEMVRIKAEIAPDHLWFTDDILGLDLQWAQEFATRLEEVGAVIPFSMQSRVNLMTEPMVAALARAGAREVWLGVESGSQKVVDAMDKGASVEAARIATRMLRRHGVKACWFIQLGYPSEEWEDLMATRDLIRAEEPDEIGVSVAYPLPGTGFYETVRRQLGTQRNWQDTGDLAMLFQGTYDSAFYRRLRDMLHAEVDTRHYDDTPWIALRETESQHRSPAPFRLDIGA